MTLPSVSNQDVQRRAHLTYIPQHAADEFRSAAVQRDPAKTSRVLETLLGVDVHFQYHPEALDEQKEIYGQLKELLTVYKATINPLFASAVHFAAASGSIEDLKKIEDPALLNATDSKGMTPLHYAIAFKKRDCILYLAERCDLKQLTPFGDSYLHYAALQGDRELLNLFIHKGLNAATPNRLGLTPAHYWASSSDDLTGLKRLKRAGADLDVQAGDLPLTPISIQILKTIEANPDPVGDVDLYLLGVNAVRSLLAATILNLPEMSLWGNRFSYHPLYTLYQISGLAQQKLVEEMVPADQTILKKVVGVPGWIESKLMGQLTTSTIPTTVNAAGTTVALASHAFNNLSRYKYADWGTRLFAVGVHALNLSASLVDCYLAFNHPFDFYKSLTKDARTQQSELVECTKKDRSTMDASEKSSCTLSARKMLDPHTDPYDDSQWNDKEASKIIGSFNDIVSELDVKNNPKKAGQLLNAERATAFLLGHPRPDIRPVASNFAKLSLQERLLHPDLQCLNNRGWPFGESQAPIIREQNLCIKKSRILLGFPSSPEKAERTYELMKTALNRPGTPPGGLSAKEQTKWLKIDEKNRTAALDVAKTALRYVMNFFAAKKTA